MEETIVKLMDLENEVNQDIDELIKLKAEIVETINQVDDPIYQLVLQMRYIDRKTWEEVAIGLGYDTRYTMKLHGRALKEIDDILKEDTKRHRKTPNECDIL